MADIPLWLQIAFKVVIAAGVVVTASVIAERSGPFVGGLILALPVSAGPAWTGIAMAFPITLTSSILIMQPAIGAAATAAVMASVVRGLAPFALAYWTIYAFAVPPGVWRALGLSLASILLWVGVLYWRGFRRR